MPSNLAYMKNLARDTHYYSTRSSSSSDIALPLPPTQMFKRSYYSMVLKCGTPFQMKKRNSSNLPCFKAMYKKYLVQTMN